MEQTKITMKICKPLLHKFNQQIDSVFIKRDALINHILKVEVKHLGEELQGLVLSSKARRYISGELKRLDTTTINVVVDKTVATKLNSVVKQSNLVRDAFANRLFMFLLSSDRLLEWLEIPLDVSGVDSKSEYINGEIPTSPLKAVEYIFSDPFFYLRLAAKERLDSGLYLLELPDNFVGLTCYMEDKHIPGTVEYEKYQEHLAIMWEELELSFLSNRTEEVAK